MRSDKLNSKSEDYIDLMQLIRILWSNKIRIARNTATIVLIGVFIAFTLRKEYTSESKLLPAGESSIKGIGGLGGLANLAGVDLGLNSSNTIGPDVYSDLTESISFQKELIYKKIECNKSDSLVTIKDYFEFYLKPTIYDYLVDYTIKLPDRLKKGSNPVNREGKASEAMFFISIEEWNTVNICKSRISVDIDKKTNVITVTSVMPEPKMAAKVNSHVIELLTKNIIDAQTRKTRVNLTFLEERLSAAKQKYENLQNQMAKFITSNRNLSSPFVTYRQELIQNELDLGYEVYKNLATQVENEKINLERETPLFTVLDPPFVPIDKSKPRRKIILIMSTLLGLIGSSVYFLIKDYLNK